MPARVEAGHHGDGLAAVAAERDRPLAGAGGAFDQAGERREDDAGARHLVAVRQRGSVQGPAAALGDAIQAGHRSIEQRRGQDAAGRHGPHDAARAPLGHAFGSRLTVSW